MIAQNPYSAAQAYLAAGDPEKALRVAGPLLERDPADLHAWYLLTSAMCHLTDLSAEQKNLDALIGAFIRTDKPLLALQGLLECDLPAERTSIHTQTLLRKYADITSPTDLVKPYSPHLPHSKSSFHAPPWSDAVKSADVIQMAQSLSAIAWGNSLSATNLPVSGSPVPWFSALDEHTATNLLKNMVLAQFQPGEVLVSQGATCDHLLLLLTGSAMDATKESDNTFESTSVFGPGSTVGELEAAMGGSFESTITATEFTSAAKISTSVIDSILDKNEMFSQHLIRRAQKEMIRQLMHRRSFLPALSSPRKAIVLKNGRLCYIPAGKDIHTENNEPFALILAVGKVIRKDDGLQVGHLSTPLYPGDWLWKGHSNEATSVPLMTAVENTVVLKLSLNEIHAIIGTDILQDTESIFGDTERIVDDTTK